MIWLLKFTAMAGVVAVAAPSAAWAKDDPLVLDRSTQWNVDFAPNKCRLAAAFGEGDDRHILFFEQYYPADSVGMTIAGPGLDRFRSRMKTELSFFQTQEPHRTEPFVGEVGQYGKGLIYSNVNVARGTDQQDDENHAPALELLDIDAAKRVEYVAVKQRGREVRLTTGPLDEAFAVMNTCTTDMIGEWGLDPERHATATRLPRWTNEEKIVGRIVREYPRAALYRGEQAILRMRVIVDQTGQVEDCVIDEATTTEKLESPACRPMMDAEFEPALDSNGDAFRSFYATSIVYQMRR